MLYYEVSGCSIISQGKISSNFHSMNTFYGKKLMHFTQSRSQIVEAYNSKRVTMVQV